MSKQTLIREIRSKVRKANPTVKAVFVSGLKYQTNQKLERIKNKVRVTRNGDISLM